MTEKQFYEYLQAYHQGDVSELKKELHTEKRFTIEIDDENFAHILDNGTDIGQYNLCKLLNELHEENEQLKQLLDYADDLIQSYMSVHNRDEWENVKKNITGDVE